MSNKEKYDKEYFEKDDFLQKEMFQSNPNDWLKELYKKNLRNTFHYQLGYLNFLVDGIIVRFLKKIDKLDRAVCSINEKMVILSFSKCTLSWIWNNKKSVTAIFAVLSMWLFAIDTLSRLVT